jgi:hypothetical protein
VLIKSESLAPFFSVLRCKILDRKMLQTWAGSEFTEGANCGAIQDGNSRSELEAIYCSFFKCW